MEQAEAFQDDVLPEETQNESQEIVEEVEEQITDETTEDIDDIIEDVEVEYEGNSYKVPPELKEALLRQSDYTRKTKELANQRKALEEQQQQFQQATEAQRQNMQGHAQLAALQNQLQQFQEIDWNQFSEDNPVEAQQAFFQYSQLKDATSNLTQQLQQQEAYALQQQQQMLARQLEQGKAELARSIPGWGQELAKSITTHGETYGFTAAELGQVVDPRMIKVLHDAYLYNQSKAKATQQPQTQIKPASKVRGKSNTNVDPDKLSTKDWLEWRNKQIYS